MGRPFRQKLISLTIWDGKQFKAIRVDDIGKIE